MSAAAEASAHLHALAAPWRVGDSVKAAIQRAARRARVDAGLAKRLWYGEARRIDSETMDRLRAAARDAQLLEDARAEYRSLQARIAACEAALGLSNTNLDRTGTHAGSRMARRENRTLDQRGEELT